MIHLDFLSTIHCLEDERFHQEIISLIEDGSIKTGKDERTLQAYIWVHLLRELKYLRNKDGSFRFKQNWTFNVELYGGNNDTPDITIRRIEDPDEILIAIEIKHYIEMNIGVREKKRIMEDIVALNRRKNGIFIISLTNSESYHDLIEEMEEMKGDNVRIIIINQEK